MREIETPRETASLSGRTAKNQSDYTMPSLEVVLTAVLLVLGSMLLLFGTSLVAMIVRGYM